MDSRVLHGILLLSCLDFSVRSLTMTRDSPFFFFLPAEAIHLKYATNCEI